MSANIAYNSQYIKIYGVKLEPDGSFNPGCEVSVYDPVENKVVSQGRNVTNKQGYFEIKLDRKTIKPGVYHIRYWGSGNRARKFQPEGDWEILEIKKFEEIYDVTPPDLTQAGYLSNYINQ